MTYFYLFLFIKFFNTQLNQIMV